MKKSISFLEIVEFDSVRAHQEGSFVKATGRIAQIPMSEAYLGHVINALAKPIDGRGEIVASESRLIESPALGRISRRSVYEPLQTGLIAIDSRARSARVHYWGQTDWQNSSSHRYNSKDTRERCKKNESERKCK